MDTRRDTVVLRTCPQNSKIFQQHFSSETMQGKKEILNEKQKLTPKKRMRMLKSLLEFSE